MSKLDKEFLICLLAEKYPNKQYILKPLYEYLDTSDYVGNYLYYGYSPEAPASGWEVLFEDTLFEIITDCVTLFQSSAYKRIFIGYQILFK